MLRKPRAQKKLANIQQRIGRLKEKSRGAGQHCDIVVTPDETGTKFPVGTDHLSRDLEHDGGLLALGRRAVDFTITDCLGAD